MPQYLCTIYEDETRYAAMSPEDMGRLYADYEAFGQAAEEAGVMVGGHALKPTPTATSVRVRDGERLTTDGPFAETREQLGGYYLLQCSSQGEAVEWAARIPSARVGTVEVREIQVYEDTGAPVETQAEAAR